MSSLFLKIIQPIPIENTFIVSEYELSKIKALGLKHNLLPLIYSQLQRHQHLVASGELITGFLNDLKNVYLKSVALSIQRETIANEIVSLFKNEGVPSVVIRGNEIAKEIYDDPYCRISSDIDILIKLSDALSVDSILTGKGYTRNDRMNLKFWFYRLHHAVYCHPETKDIVEIHWNFSIPFFFRLTSYDIWSEVVPVENSRLKLTPEMLIIMLLIHHHMHFFREFRILTDILWSIYKYEKVIDWNLFVKKMDKMGLIKTMQITLSQMKELWAETTDEIGAIQIIRHELKKIRRENNNLVSFFKIDLCSDYLFQGTKDKLMARFALDHISTIIQSFLKILFPIPEVIKELYGDRRKWTLPFNYMRFIKWRVKEWVK